MVPRLKFKNGFLIFILVSLLVGAVWSKGAVGGKGGGGNNNNPQNSNVNPDQPHSKTVKNVGRLANRNWLIYGPILVCISLITLCMMYDKIYRCYLSNQTSEIEMKPATQVPALIVESPPSTVNSGPQLTVNTASAVYSRQQSTAASTSDNSRHQLAAAIQKQESDEVQQIYHVEEGRRMGSSDRVPVQPYQVGYGGLSEAERIAMTRRLAEKIQESARRNWISDHQDAIQTDGVRLADDRVYPQDAMAQRLGVPAHSNPFAYNGTQSAGAVYLGSDPLGQIRLEMAHSRAGSQAGISKQSGSETSPADRKFDSAESGKLRGTPNPISGDRRLASQLSSQLSSQTASPNRGSRRARGERTPNERGTSRRGDVKLERGTTMREGDAGINNTATVYHPLLTDDH